MEVTAILIYFFRYFSRGVKFSIFLCHGHTIQLPYICQFSVPFCAIYTDLRIEKCFCFYLNDLFPLSFSLYGCRADDSTKYSIYIGAHISETSITAAASEPPPRRPSQYYVQYSQLRQYCSRRWYDHWKKYCRTYTTHTHCKRAAQSRRSGQKERKNLPCGALILFSYAIIRNTETRRFRRYFERALTLLYVCVCVRTYLIQFYHILLLLLVQLPRLHARMLRARLRNWKNMCVWIADADALVHFTQSCSGIMHEFLRA